MQNLTAFIYQTSLQRTHAQRNFRGKKGERERHCPVCVSETCIPLYSIPEAFIDFCRPVFFLAISWLLYCRNASLIVVVLQGVSSLTIFLSHMSCEIEHLYTNHKYKVFPSEEKSVNQAQGVYNFPLRLRCLWNATSVKNWLLDKCDVWIYVIIVKKIWKWIDDNISGGWGITAHRYCV